MKRLKIDEWNDGATYMVYSSLLLSIANLSIKVCIESLGFLESTVLRYFIPLVLLMPILVWKKKWHEIRPRLGLSMHILRSLCVVLGQTSLSYYLTRATLVNATMLWATGPIYIPIISFFLNRQKTPLFTWISVAICLLGVGMMIKPTHSIFDPFSIWGILAGILTAFSQILWGYNSEKGSATENVFYLYLLASIFALFAWIGFGNQGMGRVPETTTLWIAVVSVGLASLGNQFFRSLAYKKAPPYLLTPFLYISVVGAAILDIFFYHYWLDFWGYIGFGLVVTGTLLKWWYLRKISGQLL